MQSLLTFVKMVKQNLLLTLYIAFTDPLGYGCTTYGTPVYAAFDKDLCSHEYVIQNITSCIIKTLRVLYEDT